MAAVAVDTHALVWYVEGSPLLSAPALAVLRAAVANGDLIYVSSVCLVEIVYLIEKGKLPADLFDRIVQMLRRGDMALKEVPFTVDMSDTLRGVSRTLVPDMPDRMIAATAVALGVPLVTRDQRIRNSGVPTIWEQPTPNA
jgi:PIN domain nuclease of toxin-antitoxin system